MAVDKETQPEISAIRCRQCTRPSRVVVMAASVVACIIIIGAAITVALFYDRRGQQDAANKVAFVNAAGDLAAFVRRSFSVPSIMFAQMATALNEGSSAGFSLRNFRSQSLQLIRLNSGQ
jgi:hypothetical protein